MIVTFDPIVLQKLESNKPTHKVCAQETLEREYAMQKQQQSLDEELARRQEEYRAAQRVAVESILVGRATAEVVEQQGEQLRRAEVLADDTQYKLDKAARLLKGMTWTGWAGNLFSTNVKPPDSLSQTDSLESRSKSNDDNLRLSLERYESFPEPCQGAAQAIRNYHANVMVLVQCETDDQKDTCIQICDSMHQAAVQQLQELSTKASLQAYHLQLDTDLAILRKRQLESQSQIRVDTIVASSSPPRSGTNDVATPTDKQKEELFGRKPMSNNPPSASTSSTPTKSPALSQQEQMQTEHLQVISACLGEMGHIAQSLNRGLDQQRETIDALDTKSDNVLETSKMVGRRTERLIKDKSWTPSAASVYCATVALRHVDTGKYLAVLGGGDLYLVNKFSSATCVFDLHRRQQGGSKIVGLRSHNNRKWVGQSFLTGSLSCVASQFARREEWEIDHPPSSDNNASTEPTRLLCVSASWGNGGYMQVRPSDFALFIGGATVADSKAAARWILIPQEAS
jgi:hypothetical protein